MTLPDPQQPSSPLHRPFCSKCGTLSTLIRIEPSGMPGQDVRTFECQSCGHVDTVTMNFK